MSRCSQRALNDCASCALSTSSSFRRLGSARALNTLSASVTAHHPRDSVRHLRQQVMTIEHFCGSYAGSYLHVNDNAQRSFKIGCAAIAVATDRSSRAHNRCVRTMPAKDRRTNRIQGRPRPKGKYFWRLTRAILPRSLGVPSLKRSSVQNARRRSGCDIV
jgi:hypothetical protein